VTAGGIAGRYVIVMHAESPISFGWSARAGFVVPENPLSLRIEAQGGAECPIAVCQTPPRDLSVRGNANEVYLFRVLLLWILVCTGFAASPNTATAVSIPKIVWDEGQSKLDHG
jgi:hypothetical protein